MSAPQTDEQDLPEFLRNPDAFGAHLDVQFAELENSGKGDAFLEFAMRLMPLCDFWADFPSPKKSPKKTHDKGVDFQANTEDTSVLYCGQSKYRIREVAEFDQVISKFKNFEVSLGPKQLKVPGTDQSEPTQLRFVLVTASSLKGIIAKYENSALPSRSDYVRYRNEGRFEIVDGPRLLGLLQVLYRRSYLLAPDVDIKLAAPYIQVQNVYISVVSGRVLCDLYEKHGNSLFFENIREFIGASGAGKRESVNDEIAETLREAPDRMLGRNNGVTLKAESVIVVDDRHLRLSRCSIVNGCQTTMSVVQAGDAGHGANVLMKIVLSEDSWAVAKAANYQNAVTRIELDLARFLRPQLIIKMATDMGYGAKVPNVETVANVLEAVHLQKISYDSMKYLYLGLFSRFPNNLFESNYSELRPDVLNAFYQDNKADYLMRVLFQLLRRMEEGAESLRKRYRDDVYAEIFVRFFQEDKIQYRCLLAILAACGSTGESVTDKPPQTSEAYAAMQRFIRKLEVVLSLHAAYFEKVFLHAFVALAGKITDSGSDGTPQDLAQRMWREVNSSAGSRFANLLVKLHLLLKSDDVLISSQPDFSGI